MQAGNAVKRSETNGIVGYDRLPVEILVKCVLYYRENAMEDQKKTTKGPFIGGCVVGLIIGIVSSVIVGSVISFFAFRTHAMMGGTLIQESSHVRSMSFTDTLGQYELANADAVKEFNARIKKWFGERGFKELEDMPLRSLIRSPVKGNVWMQDHEGNWNKPGVLLLLKFDEQNSLYILVPDCYHRENNIQMIGYRADFALSSNKARDYEIQLDKLKDDFERTFPSGDYKKGLPE